jgi:hypothetical protein
MLGPEMEMEMDDSDNIKEYAKPMQCGHCGNKTVMELMANFYKVLDEGYEERRYYEELVKWKLLFCPVCSSVNLIRANWILWDGRSDYEEYDVDPEPESEDAYEVLYPTYGKQIPGLPHDVALEYQSACKVRNIDSNAFGVLVGRVLDEVCTNRGAEGKTLFERLKSLAEKGEIPERLTCVELFLSMCMPLLN